MTKEELPIGFGDIEYLALSLILAVIISVVSILTQKIKKGRSEIDMKKGIPFGYYLSISTAIIIICAPMLSNIAELINITVI